MVTMAIKMRDIVDRYIYIVLKPRTIILALSLDHLHKAIDVRHLEFELMLPGDVKSRFHALHCNAKGSAVGRRGGSRFS